MVDQIQLDDILKEVDTLWQEKQIQHNQAISLLGEIQIRELLTEDLRPQMEQMADLALSDINLVGVESTKPIIGPLLTIIKRAIRKSTFWLYQPLFQRISGFHGILQTIVHSTTAVIDDDLYATERKLALLDRHVGQSFASVSDRLSNMEEGVLVEMARLREEIEGYKSEASLLRAKLSEALQGQSTLKTSSEEQEGLGSVTKSDISGPAASYFTFEQQFRGSEETIRTRLLGYMEDIQEAYRSCGGYALDMGCGRGELLDLCKEMEIPAKGVDSNQGMIRHCLDKGLDVTYCDGIEYVQSLPDNSLCAFMAIQVVEHIPYDGIWSLLSLVLLKLKPGGIILLETVNPDSFVPFKNFYVDPTHVQPIPAITLRFALESVGFKDAQIKLSSPFDPKFMLQGEDGNTKKLNDLLFGHIDYSVMGRK